MSSSNLLGGDDGGDLGENFQGIEEISHEMPSKTIGRKRGEYLERMLTDDTFFEQTMARSSIRRRKKSSAKILTQDNNTALAVEDYERIQSGEIRDLPFSMKFKRNLRNRYKMTNNQKENGILTATNSKVMNEYKRQISTSFTIWSNDLKKIEGNFGSGVASYFLFLRGLFFLSVPSFVLSFCFISLPQLIVAPERDNQTIKFTGEELLTGSNWLTDTIMYYGHYVNGTINPNPDNALAYEMPLAYLLALFFYFLVCLIWLFRETAINFRQSYVDATLDSMHFTNKIFCSWNYGIISHQSADLLHKSIYFDLKEVLAEKKISATKRESGICKIYLKRIVVWITWILITGGSIAFVYYLNKDIIDQISPVEGDESEILHELLLPLFVSTVNLIAPYLILFLSRFESYNNPRSELFITIFRTFFLKIGMLATICVHWTEIIQTNDDVTTTSDVDVETCWETKLGEEVYRLVIFDFLFSIIFSTFFMEFVRRIISDQFEIGNRAIFSISINVLDLIYGQTLCWVGIFFSPILSLIVIIKYILLFYIKKISVLANCRPSKRRWRASQSRTFFNSLLLLCFLSSFAFIGYVVYSVKPSNNCGPFRGLNNSYSVITNTFEELNGNAIWFSTIVSIIFSVWFLFGVVASLLIYTIFIRSRTLAKRNLTERLKSQIELEGKDKCLLLNWLRTISDNPQAVNTMKQFNLKEKNHRAPVMERHRESVNSRGHSRSSSILLPQHRYSRYVPDVQMTHVDPQHAMFNADSSRSPEHANGRRIEHQDPMITRAFINQVRPISQYHPNELQHEDMRPYSKSVSQGRGDDSISPLQLALASKQQQQQTSPYQQQDDGENDVNPIAQEWSQMQSMFGRKEK